MKNFFKLLGIISLALVIGFSMAGCKNDDDDGGENNNGNSNTPGGSSANITITGIPAEFNGKYILLEGVVDTEVNYTMHRGVASTSGNNYTRAQISNGSATMDLYKVVTGGYEKVTTTVTLGAVYFSVWNAASGGTNATGGTTKTLVGSITFTDGKAAINYSTLTWKQ